MGLLHIGHGVAPHYAHESNHRPIFIHTHTHTCMHIRARKHTYTKHTHTKHTHTQNTHTHNTHTRSLTHSLSHRPERGYRVKVLHSHPAQAAYVEDGKCEKGHSYDADVPRTSNSHPAGMGVLRQSHDMTGGVQDLVYVEHSQDQA